MVRIAFKSTAFMLSKSTPHNVYITDRESCHRTLALYVTGRGWEQPGYASIAFNFARQESSDKMKQLINDTIKYQMKNTDSTVLTTEDVAAGFHELAQKEKWFEIQEQFFAENVRSIYPTNSPYFGYAEGRENVRKKGEDFVKKITGVHSASTTQPIVVGNHFVVGREMDVTVDGLGRIQLNEIMLYEVKDGQIVLEQFFY
jgi:hypothetical protein